MPPMLNVPLLEVAGRTSEEVPANEARFRVNERHHVLQLIAETEGAARLVVSAPCPKTARECLVEEPAIGQDVNGPVGCFDIHCAEGMAPVMPDSFESSSRPGRS